MSSPVYRTWPALEAAGYPKYWQADWPGPYPLGMPIWLDSWGPMPPLVAYGNGTDEPGPLLPGPYIALQTHLANAGLAPMMEPIPLATLFNSPSTANSSSSNSSSAPPPPPEITDMAAPGILAALQARGLGAGLNTGYFPTRTLVQGGTIGGAGPTPPPANFSVGGAATTLSNAGACDLLPEGAARTACKLALGIFSGSGAAGATVAAGATAGYNAGVAMTNSGGCPPGFVLIFGKCTAPQNALPGGQPLTLGGTGVATTGGMGLSAITPTQVGTITRKDGTTGPILRCPGRYVLGLDFLCYPKSMIPNQLRAHPRGTRPLLTGGEVKVLRKAKSLAKKVGKLGRQFGPKTCHCKPTKGRKK